MHKQVSCTLRHLSSSEAVVTFRVSGHLPGLHPNSYKPGWGCDTAATFVSEFQCPLLAQSGHRATEFQCRLLGVKRTSEESAAMSALTQSGHRRPRSPQTMDRSTTRRFG